MDGSGDSVLLHLPTGTYLRLDGSASRIVDLLQEDPDPGRAARILAEQYGIPTERALADVEAVVVSVHGLSARRTARIRRPTATGVRSVTRAWWDMPWDYRITTARVAAAVVAVEAGLKLTSLDRLSMRLGVPLGTDPGRVPDVGPDDLTGLSASEQRAHWSVRWVLARWVYDSTCLRKALVLGFFLRGHHPVLRLGMIDDAGGVAHAWIEVDGRAFDAQPVTGAFASGPVPTDPPDRPGADTQALP